MTLQQLRYVVTITEIGTISKAAEELFVSQPSLTKALKELEKENADRSLTARTKEFMYPEKERSSLDTQDRCWNRRH